MSDIGKHIVKYRKAANLTQDALGEKLHVTRQTVSSWENGRTLPGIDMLSDIAESLNVSVEHIIYGTDISREPRDTSVYKKSAAISAAVMIICTALAVIIKPQMGFTADTYRVAPEIFYYSVFRPLAYMAGAVLFLSLVSVIADISLRSFRARYALTALGAVVLLLFIASVLAVYSVVSGVIWLHYVWMFGATHPYVFAVPAAALFFGFNRSV